MLCRKFALSLPTSAVRPTLAWPVTIGWHGASYTSSDESMASAGAASLRMHISALDDTPASLEAALRRMQELRPKQVMLETCSQRRRLAEQRAGVAPAGTLKSTGGTAAAALSHADAIDVVHGGIRGSAIVALLKEAGSLDAQVYAVDRPYQETQNRVARRLVLHPRELLAFARYAAVVLGRGGKGSEAEPCPTAVQEILTTERERHMAAEMARRAVRGADALLLCTQPRADGLRRLLNSPLAPAPAVPADRATRVWPFLLVFLYVILPGYGSIFCAWRASCWLAGALSASSSGGPPVQPEVAPSMLHGAGPTGTSEGRQGEVA